MGVEVGAPAPEFSLPGTSGTVESRRTYALAEARGETLVLVFYPGDATPVCTRQLNAYSHDIERFGEVGATVWAISPQGLESHDEFSCAQGGFGFPLLADTDKAVGGAYGILGPLGFYRRSVFVVDPLGVVRYAHRAVAGLTYRSTDELVAAVRAATAA
ncbi:MAG: peroxiredoxin [Acidimicrobiia bacterium]